MTERVDLINTISKRDFPLLFDDFVTSFVEKLCPWSVLQACKLRMKKG